MLLVLALALAACGGKSPGPSAGGGDNTPSTAASAAANPSTAAASSGGHANNGDLQSLVDNLKPPNSSQVANFSTDTTSVVTYTSSDSVDSLKSFYDKAISDAGLSVMGTTDVSGAHSWIVTNDANNLGGTITVAPDPSGSGTSVSVAVGSE
jgi:hypothetical protein